MEPIVRHTGIVAPLDRADVDTDQILPGQFMKRIERTGFGPFLFFELRHLGDGQPNPAFDLNHPGYRGASILVAGHNFGCGSSREHAVWALQNYGFRVLIAQSFADIFRSNCFNNGLLPLTLPEEDVLRLQDRARAEPGYRLSVDLERCIVEDEDGLEIPFTIDPHRRHCLLKGLDHIDLTLRFDAEIQAYEDRIPPWRRIAVR